MNVSGLEFGSMFLFNSCSEILAWVDSLVCYVDVSGKWNTLEYARIPKWVRKRVEFTYYFSESTYLLRRVVTPVWIGMDQRRSRERLSHDAGMNCHHGLTLARHGLAAD